MNEFDISICDESGVLTIIPSPEVTSKNFIEDLVDALSWQDLDLTRSHMDGWTYIVSQNRQLVFPMDDYGYNLMSDLMKGDTVIVIGRENKPDYDEYEWNNEGD